MKLVGNRCRLRMLMPNEIMKIMTIQLFTSKKEKGQFFSCFFWVMRSVCL